MAISHILCTFASSKKACKMLIKLYNDNPNVREVRRVADALRDGEVLILPTDTLYAFVCSMEHKRSVEEIAQLKGFKIKQAKYSMLCSSLSMASEYVRAMDRDTFALLKRSLPGPFTFIMEAAGTLPRNYQNANKTIGVRVPSAPSHAPSSKSSACRSSALRCAPSARTTTNPSTTPTPSSSTTASATACGPWSTAASPTPTPRP